MMLATLLHAKSKSYDSKVGKNGDWESLSMAGVDYSVFLVIHSAHSYRCNVSTVRHLRSESPAPLSMNKT